MFRLKCQAGRIGFKCAVYIHLNVYIFPVLKCTSTVFYIGNLHPLSALSSHPINYSGTCSAFHEILTSLSFIRLVNIEPEI